MEDTKFKEGDYVKIVKGFRRGQKGIVWGYSDTDKTYTIEGICGWHPEDSLEIAHRPKPNPWWKFW